MKRFGTIVCGGLGLALLSATACSVLAKGIDRYAWLKTAQSAAVYTMDGTAWDLRIACIGNPSRIQIIVQNIEERASSYPMTIAVGGASRRVIGRVDHDGLGRIYFELPAGDPLVSALAKWRGPIRFHDKMGWSSVPSSKTVQQIASNCNRSTAR